MPKKKLSDIVFQRIEPPDHKKQVEIEDLSRVLVKRLGLKRKEGRANHSKLMLEFIKYRKDNIPLGFEEISKILGVSQSQTYEELRKWRTLGLVDFVRIPVGNDLSKGYMLTGNTVNRLLDKVESNTKSFLRQTRRIAKDFDDLLMLDMARKDKTIKKELENDKEGEEELLEDDGNEDDNNDEEPEEEPEIDDKKISDVSDESDKEDDNSEDEDIDSEIDDEKDEKEPQV